MGYDKEVMDQAASLARRELLQRLTSDDGTDIVRGVHVLSVWLKKHYRTAGYRRLCRFLIQELLPKMEAGEF